MQLTQITPRASSHNPSVFKFGRNEIRVFEKDREPWFLAADVCKALELTNPTASLKVLAPSEKNKIDIGRPEKANVISESGLYVLILRCQDAIKEGSIAYEFRIWVTKEVLPAIRKTGQYSATEESSEAATLTPAQQLAIQQAVGRRAQKTANHYQTIYRAIKLRYQIARYDQLPQSLFEDCLRFIETVDLHTPEVVEHPSPLPVAHSEPKDPSRYLTDNELSSLDSVHRFHRDPYFKIAYEVAYNALRAAHSRYAGRFYDVMTECDLSLFRIGRILERNGIEHF